MFRFSLSGFGALLTKGLPHILITSSGACFTHPPELSKKGAHFMLRLKRVHDTGTQVLLRQCEDGWHMNIDLRETNHNPMTISGYLVPTVERAKELADKELRKYGHVCNGSCPDWIEVLSALG